MIINALYVLNKKKVTAIIFIGLTWCQALIYMFYVYKLIESSEQPSEAALLSPHPHTL